MKKVKMNELKYGYEKAIREEFLKTDLEVKNNVSHIVSEIDLMNWKLEEKERERLKL